MRKDNFLLGILLGAAAPAMAFLAEAFLPAAYARQEKPLTYFILAALLNLFLIRFFFKREKGKLAQGLVLITFLAALLLLLKGI